MRGGARPFIVWAAILAVFGTINAIWTGDGIQMAEYGASILFALVIPAILILRSRDALRGGEPTPPPGAQPAPTRSYGAALLALGFATALYGFAFGHFFVYFGLGLFAAAIGRLAIELHSQARSRRDLDQHPPARPEP